MRYWFQYVTHSISLALFSPRTTNSLLLLCVLIGSISSSSAYAQESFSALEFVTKGQTIAEGNTATIELQRTGFAQESVTAEVFAIEDRSTASNGTDVKWSAQRLSWQVDEIGTKSIVLPVLEDNELERTETFILGIRVIEGTDSVDGVVEHQVSITDVQPVEPNFIQLSESNVSVSETDGAVSLQVTRTGGGTGKISATAIVSNGSAISGEDFKVNFGQSDIDKSGQILWNDGDTFAKSIVFDIIDDGVPEPTEDFQLSLDSLVGATLGGPGKANVTILNVDPEPSSQIRLTETDQRIAENAGNVDIKIERVGGSAGFLSADLIISDGDAKNGEDFVIESPQRLIWQDGDTESKVVSIPIIYDNQNETDEKFSVTLRASGNTLPESIGTPSSQSIVITNVAPPSPGKAQFSVASTTVKEDAGIVLVSVRRVDGSTGNLRVQIATQDGTARAGEDYEQLAPTTLVWDTTDTREQTVEIPIINNDTFEPSEQFSVVLSNIGEDDAVGSPARLTVTIEDDEPRPLPGTIRFSTASQSVDEDAGTVTVVVQRVGGSAGNVTAQIATEAGEGSATAGEDYTALASTTLRWNSGDAREQSITIPIIDDKIREPQEQFRVVLFAAGETSPIGTPNTQTITINDDDPEPETGSLRFSKATDSVDEDAGQVTVVVQRVGGSAGVLRAQIQTRDGTAQAGSDYSALAPTTLTWQADDTRPQSIDIPILNDSARESAEQFSVLLSGDDNVIGTPSSITVTINANDEPPPATGSIRFSKATDSVDENSGEITVLVQRVGGSAGTLQAQIATRNGTAQAGSDYSALAPTTLTWEAGDTQAIPISINIINDTVRESTEQFDVVLSAFGEGGSIGDPATLTVTINDDDPIPASGNIRFSRATDSVNENAGSITVVVQRVGGSAGVMQARIATRNGSATASQDFTAVSTTLTWAAGDSIQKTLDIPITNDSTQESAEQFTVTLTPAGENDSVGSPNTLTVTINDDDEPPPPSGSIRLTKSSDTVSESAGKITIIAERTGGSGGTLSARISTRDGTAEAGTDYESLNTTLTWAAGESGQKQLDITILPDSVNESVEQFTVNLGAVEGTNGSAIGSPATATISITNVAPEPTGQLRFSEPSITIFEDVSSVIVGVERIGGARGALSARVSSIDGSASSGEDYEGLSPPLTLNWSDGDTETQLVIIPIINDGVFEEDETFTLALEAAGSTSSEVIVPPDTVQVTIANVQPPASGTIRFSQFAQSVTETFGQVSVEVERTGGATGELSVTVTTEDENALDGIDYTGIAAAQVLTWADGDMASKSITIPILSDNEIESNETFALVLNAGNPGILSEPTRHTVTITDNSNPGLLRFTQSDVTTSETAGVARIDVERTGGSSGEVSVQYDTIANSATATDDFEPVSGTLRWQSGEIARKTIEVPIIADSFTEGSEQFFVALSQATPLGDDLQLGLPSQVTVTIADDQTSSPGKVSFSQTTISASEDIGDVQLGLRREGGSTGAISVSVSTRDGTAIDGTDYGAIETLVNWADGESGEKLISVPIIDDALFEDDKSFSVVLNSANPNLLGANTQVFITIQDNDPEISEGLNAGTLTLSPLTSTVSEGAGTIEFEIQRTLGSAGAISVSYEFLSGTAISGEDFQGSSGILNWSDGDTTSRTVTVDILRDNLVEEIESFSLRLQNESAPVNHTLTIANRSASVSISDDTNSGTLQLLAAAITVDENDEIVNVSAERVGGSDGVLEALVVVEGITAAAGTDFTATTTTLRWEDGELGERTVAIQILRDDLVEEDETFVVSLQPVSDSIVVLPSANQTVITIQDATPPLDSPYDLRIVSGDNQQASLGDTLDPLVIAVASIENELEIQTGINIRWRAEPAGAVRFLDGDFTATDASGQTSNRVEVLSTGFIRVIATALGSVTETTTAISPANRQRSSRIDPPPIELAQGQVAFTIRSGLEAIPGLSFNQSRTAAALDAACLALDLALTAGEALSPAQLDLQQTCEALAQSTTLGNDLDRLAAEEVFLIADSLVDTSDMQVTNIYSRINALRSGKYDRLDLSGLQLRIYDQTIPGSVLEAAQNAVTLQATGDEQLSPITSSGDFSSRLGFFVNGSLSSGEIDGDGNQQDADVITSGVTLGADYRFTDNIVFGAGLGLIQNETTFTSTQGGADITGLNLTLFGTWYESDTGYLDVVLDLGQNNYDIRRLMSINANINDVFAVGETDASVFSFNVGAGRNFSSNGYEFGPYLRLSIVDGTVDGYRERAIGGNPGFGSALNIRSHSVRSTTLSVGGQISKSISADFGVLLPQIRFEYESENEVRKDGITATFLADPSDTAFTLQGDERDSSYFNVGLGSSALFRNGKSGFLFYETRLQHDYVTQHWMKVGFRMEF